MSHWSPAARQVAPSANGAEGQPQAPATKKPLSSGHSSIASQVPSVSVSGRRSSAGHVGLVPSQTSSMSQMSAVGPQTVSAGSDLAGGGAAVTVQDVSVVAKLARIDVAVAAGWSARSGVAGVVLDQIRL